MKNKKHILIFAALLLVLLAVPVWGRAGGGGSSGGGGGGSSSGGGSYSSHSGSYRGGRGSGIAGMILQAGVVFFAASGGSIVLIRKPGPPEPGAGKPWLFTPRWEITGITGKSRSR